MFDEIQQRMKSIKKIIIALQLMIVSTNIIGQIDTVFCDSNIVFVGDKKDNKFNGKWEIHKNSELVGYITYENGVAEGEAIIYHSNGNVYIRAFFLDGRLHGNVFYYNLDNVMIANLLFNNDVLESVWYYIKDDFTPPRNRTYRPKLFFLECFP